MYKSVFIITFLIFNFNVMDISVGILFALIYACISAIGQVALKISLKNFSSSVSFFYETLCGILLWIPFAFILGGVKLEEVIAVLPIVIVGAVLSEAYIFYMYSKGDLSIIAPVFSTFSIYTVIFSRIINNETLSSYALIFITLTICGSVIIAYRRKVNLTNESNFKTVLWALSGAIAVGFADTLAKSSIDETSATTFIFTLAIVQIPVSLIYLKLEKNKLQEILRVKNDFEKYKFSLLAALFIAFSMIFFVLSFEFTLASIASPVTSTNLMFTVIFARLFLKEKILRKNFFGIILIVVGVMGINIVR